MRSRTRARHPWNNSMLMEGFLSWIPNYLLIIWTFFLYYYYIQFQLFIGSGIFYNLLISLSKRFNDEFILDILFDLFPDSFEIDPLIEPSTCTGTDNDSEPVYGNVGCAIPPIRVEDLWDFVKQNKENNMEGLKTEYRVRD